MPENAHLLPEKLDMPDAEVLFYRDFFNPTESESLFHELEMTIQWEQTSFRMGGKDIPVPRLTAWYGDEGKSYRYSGITLHPRPWIPMLLNIKAHVESVTEARFNSVLLNLYRHGNDSVSWHSDDEPELGYNPVIASVSLGATRRFQFKHKHKAELRVTLDLTPGSLLLMQGETQHFWKHQIPKTQTPTGPRINLTFRVIR
jgi:alkylated DNA repair dioxygenase AlkB